MIKKCLLCGKEFEATRASQKYCKRKHYATCVVCHKKFLIKKLNQPAKTCSSHCASILSHNEKSKEKRKENSLKKWGTESPLQAKEIKEKIQNSLDHSENDKRFGSKNFQKIIKDKYGVINASQIEEVKEKKKETMLKHYGVENPMQSDEIKNKQIESTLEHYGMPSYSKVYSNLKAINRKKAEEWKNIEKTIKSWKKKPTRLEVANYFDTDPVNIGSRISKGDLDPELLKTITSQGELELKKYIKKNHPNIKMIQHDRTLIYPLELDFFFPDKKFAIEVSPSSTHNTLNSFGHHSERDKNYHKRKFIECANKNVELITIFDWHDKNKIYEMIDNKLNDSSKRVFARKTQYKEYKSITKELFNDLNDWHILNLSKTIKRKNTVGTLIYDNKIVGIALWTPTKDNTKIELKRMVFRPGISVVGGASKLLKNFIKNHNYKSIITYSDCDLGEGKVYKKIGFSLINQSQPGLNFYNIYYEKHVKYTSLIMLGADRLLRDFPKYKKVGIGNNLPTNKEIMLKYGFLPVYDCGYRKWEMKIV